MTNQTDRPYRKNVAKQGLIYMGGKELEVLIKNYSISGLLAELTGEHQYLEVKDIYQAISNCPVLDFYIPEMRMSGEVDVVRVDIEDSRILMALNFKYVSHDVDQCLYQRKAYRKLMSATGKILLEDIFIDFETINVSIDGLMIRLLDNVEVNAGTITAFRFRQLGLEGAVKVVWVEHADGTTLLGLEYIRMSRTQIEGIPVFAKR
ncbi:MAG: PilZ domain-containing protein [Methylococcales bacterium]|nr:PilZ domain-containing protein [Methylococcaceae bacterium]